MNNKTKQKQIREEIAALEHDQWITWADSIMKSEKVSPERNKRWLSLFVPYAELSEEMKDHDRKWADKIMAIFAREQEEMIQKVAWATSTTPRTIKKWMKSFDDLTTQLPEEKE